LGAADEGDVRSPGNAADDHALTFGDGLGEMPK
jgi:hypothetical protein